MLDFNMCTCILNHVNLTSSDTLTGVVEIFSVPLENGFEHLAVG